MLDSKGFVSAGWVHDLSLHSFVTQSQRKYLVKAKVSHKLTYSTGHRQRQNETRSNAFGGQTQTRLRSPRPSKLCWEQSSAQSMISTRSKTAANQLTSLP